MPATSPASEARSASPEEASPCCLPYFNQGQSGPIVPQETFVIPAHPTVPGELSASRRLSPRVLASHSNWPTQDVSSESGTQCESVAVAKWRLLELSDT